MSSPVPPVRAREWSTADLPDREQFPLWAQTVAEAFVPVEVRGDAESGFASGVQVRRVGGIEVADLQSQAQSVRRTAEQARRTPGDVYFLNLPLGDGASAAQDGHEARLRPGDFVLVDGDRPFALDFDAPFEQVSLKIPRELLERRLHHPAEIVGQRVRGDAGIGAVASAAIRSTAAVMATLDHRSARALGERLADLVALAAGDLSAQQTRPEPLLWRAVQEVVERDLGDPALTPAAVAERAGVSVRHLHRLFSAHGPSFGRWVLERRLELAFADLADPELRDRPISRIAGDHGFADPSYFARAFRVRYAITPRELRASAIRRSTAA